MKLGLDIHGVIDSNPEVFAILSNLLIHAGHEVHIITGEEASEKLEAQLKEWNISYTCLFSVVAYHKTIGTEINWKDADHPWMDEEVWNVTKAWYCSKMKIDLHIDDSDIYGQYFKTPYLRYHNVKT